MLLLLLLLLLLPLLLLIALTSCGRYSQSCMLYTASSSMQHLLGVCCPILQALLLRSSWANTTASSAQGLLQCI
jgi:hypothetical protein